MFTAVLFTIAKIQKQQKCSSVDTWFFWILTYCLKTKDRFDKSGGYFVVNEERSWRRNVHTSLWFSVLVAGLSEWPWTLRCPWQRGSGPSSLHRPGREMAVPCRDRGQLTYPRAGSEFREAMENGTLGWDKPHATWQRKATVDGSQYQLQTTWRLDPVILSS